MLERVFEDPNSTPLDEGAKDIHAVGACNLLSQLRHQTRILACPCHQTACGERSVGSLNGTLGKCEQQFGAQNEYVIRARVAKAGSDANDTQATADAVRHALDAVLGTGNYTVLRTEAVGPKVGGELRQKAFLAIFLSFFAVLAYLAYRFEWRFGLAAVIATAHDILATIAFIGVLRLEVSLTVVAAVLSMVGYSLNDTIITMDIGGTSTEQDFVLPTFEGDKGLQASNVTAA